MTGLLLHPLNLAIRPPTESLLSLGWTPAMHAVVARPSGGVTTGGVGAEVMAQPNGAGWGCGVQSRVGQLVATWAGRSNSDGLGAGMEGDTDQPRASAEPTARERWRPRWLVVAVRARGGWHRPSLGCVGWSVSVEFSRNWCVPRWAVKPDLGAVVLGGAETSLPVLSDVCQHRWQKIFSSRPTAQCWSGTEPEKKFSDTPCFGVQQVPNGAQPRPS